MKTIILLLLVQWSCLANSDTALVSINATNELPIQVKNTEACNTLVVSLVELFPTSNIDIACISDLGIIESKIRCSNETCDVIYLGK